MPLQRTTEHFKYRNRAVRQATYLNPYDKVVLIAIAEFAHDDGVFWHGFRTIARAAGVSVGQAYKSIQRFIADGVLVLIKKGKPGYSKVTSTYQIVLDKIPEHPSIYDLAKNPQTMDEPVDEQSDLSEETEEGARSPDERAEPNRSRDERTNGARSLRERSSFTIRTEGVDFDVDSNQGVDSRSGVDRSAASQPCANPLLNPVSQNQNQNRSGFAEGPNKVVYAPKWKPAAVEEEEAKSNPKTKTNPDGLPLVTQMFGKACCHCSRSCGQPHHWSCFIVTGMFQ